MITKLQAEKYKELIKWLHSLQSYKNRELGR